MEGFGLNLTNIVGATPGNTSAYATIQDNDPLPGVSVNDVTIDEAAGTPDVIAQFTVALAGASSQPISVNYYTTDGTAHTADGDYNPAYGMLNFAPGETSKLVNATVHNDALDEINETFQLNLTTGSGATITDGQGLGTIIDDDGPTASINDVTVDEGAGTPTTTAQFTVALSAPSPQTITVNYVTADNTALAGQDYTAQNGTRTFAPGETSKTIAITVANDDLYERTRPSPSISPAPRTRRFWMSTVSARSSTTIRRRRSRSCTLQVTTTLSSSPTTIASSISAPRPSAHLSTRRLLSATSAKANCCSI